MTLPRSIHSLRFSGFGSSWSRGSGCVVRFLAVRGGLVAAAHLFRRKVEEGEDWSIW